MAAEQNGNGTRAVNGAMRWALTGAIGLLVAILGYLGGGTISRVGDLEKGRNENRQMITSHEAAQVERDRALDARLATIEGQLKMINDKLDRKR